MSSSRRRTSARGGWVVRACDPVRAGGTGTASASRGLHDDAPGVDLKDTGCRSDSPHEFSYGGDDARVLRVARDVERVVAGRIGQASVAEVVAEQLGLGSLIDGRAHAPEAVTLLWRSRLVSPCTQRRSLGARDAADRRQGQALFEHAQRRAHRRVGVQDAIVSCTADSVPRVGFEPTLEWLFETIASAVGLPGLTADNGSGGLWRDGLGKLSSDLVQLSGRWQPSEGEQPCGRRGTQ